MATSICPGGCCRKLNGREMSAASLTVVLQGCKINLLHSQDVHTMGSIQHIVDVPVLCHCTESDMLCQET